MKRFATRYVLFKKDFESKAIKKQLFKGLTEYWVYRAEKSDLIGITGKHIDKSKLKLHAIILCDKNHITEETDNRVEIAGVRFTNDITGNDLADYLSKTKRG